MLTEISQYGNGQIVSNDYDSLHRVTTKKYQPSSISTVQDRYTYNYDASGNICYQNDLINRVNYRYIYDIADRLVQLKDSLGNMLSYSYDKNNNNSKISDKINGTTYDTSYAYDKDNKPNSITYNRGTGTNITTNTITQSYDTTLGRLTGKTVSTGAGRYGTTYGYLPGMNGSATTKIGSVTNNGVAISYTYNANSKINTITNAYDAGANITKKQICNFIVII